MCLCVCVSVSVSVSVLLRGCLGELHSKNSSNSTKVSCQTRIAPTTPTPKKNVELAVNSRFFLELLKRCFKNTCYEHPHRVEIKLPTTATLYTSYCFRRKKKEPSASPLRAACASPSPPLPPGASRFPTAPCLPRISLCAAGRAAFL